MIKYLNQQLSLKKPNSRAYKKNTKKTMEILHTKEQINSTTTHKNYPQKS